MSKKIFYSFIIACYNSEKYLSETIDSIINQTYKNYEIILINDGSTDSTLSILKKYEKNYKFIRVFSNENKGLAYSRNFAVDKANYEWIVIMDHDDVCYPNRLSQYNKIISKNSDLGLIFSDMTYFNDQTSFSRFEKNFNYNKIYPYNLNLNKNKSFINLIRYGCFIGSSSVVFKKSIFNKTQKFNTSYKFLTDYVLFLEFAKINNMFCIDIPLVKWRMHSSQSTNINSSLYYYEMCKLYQSIYFDRLINLKLKISILIKYIFYFYKFLLIKFNLKKS